MTCSSFYIAFTSELTVGRNNFIYNFVSSNGDSRGRSKAKFFRNFPALKKCKFSQICVAVAFMLLVCCSETLGVSCSVHLDLHCLETSEHIS